MTRKTVCGTCHSIEKRAFFAVALCAAAAMPALADAYAYKVQYLESTGAQYIDTGVTADANTMFRGRYEYLLANGNYDMIAGSTTPRYYPISLNGKNPNKERYVYRNSSPAQTHPYRTSHSIVFNDPQHRVFVDGKYIGSVSDFTTNTRQCFLFASNDSGKANYYSTARIFWCEFTDTGTGEVLRRFIPVVDENGRPAMFDEINEKLYYNLGTGADFTAGPRKEEPWYFVEYLESTGTQWIDTETLAFAETRTDVGYMYTQTSQNKYAMISGVNSPSRYYPVSLPGTDGRKERYDRGSNAGSEFTFTHPTLADHEVVFNDDGRCVYVDGVEIATFTAAYTDSSLSAYMFAARNVTDNKADWLAKARIYHYDIYHTNGTLCAAFRPAVNASGKGCMYNGYTGKIHENGGTGDFALGRIVSPKVALDLSSRNDLAEGLKVMSFTVRPSWGTVFELDAATAATYDAEVRSDGVYLAAKNAAAAAVVTVTGDTVANFAAGAMPQCSSVVLSGTVRLTANCDWRGLGKIVIPDGVTIDLNGYDLQTVGFTTLPDTFAMITDTSAAGSGGRLRVEVAANGLFMNDRVPLMGSLRLVKEGAGLYLAELERQQYSGGTEVAGGTLRMKYTAAAFGNQVPANTEVLVGANGTFDANGNSWGYHIYTLDGGILTSSRRARSDSGTVHSPFTLTVDSVVSNKNFGLICQSWGEVKVRLNGHTLRYDGLPGSGNAFFFAHATFEGEGKVEIGSSWICATNKTYANIGRNLTLEQARRTSGGLWLDAPFTVSNCVMRGSAYKGGETLTVLDRFAPLEESTNYFPNVALADGSTLDLSDCTGIAFNVLAKNGNLVTFPDGGTVTLDLSERSDLADGLLVVAWDAIPSTTTFALDDVTVVDWRAVAGAEGVTLVAKGPRDIEFAEWTGAAGNGLATDPDNWTCYDFDGAEVEGALPGVATTIRVTGTTTLPYPTGVAWGRLMLSGDVTLGANCDWREFGTVDIPTGVTVNLNGHELKVSSFCGAGTVNGASGTLRVDVAEGDTLTNSSLLLSGGISLVKDGAGTFVPDKAGQQYAGGTTVSAGSLKMSRKGVNLTLGAEGSTFTVNDGATFDFNGQYDYNYYKCVLAGGTLANRSGTNMGGGNARWYGSLSNIVLTADSSIDITGSMLLGGGAIGSAFASVIDLGGHTLTATIRKEEAQLYLNGVTVTNGTLAVRRTDGIGVAWLHIYNDTQAPAATLDLDTCIALYNTITVDGLVNRYSGRKTTGPGYVRVKGTFKPVSDSHPEVVMLDGSRIDLTEYAGTFSARSMLGDVAPRFLGAEGGAQVLIDITGRNDLRNGDRVIEWEAPPEIVHRWSFNGDWTDSVGGATAEAVGAATLGSTTVTTPGSEVGHVSLGSWLIPTNAGPVTVEIWAAQNEKRGNAKIFTCGDDSGDHGFCLMNNNDASLYKGWLSLKSGSSIDDSAWSSCGAPVLGRMEHFAIMMDNAPAPIGSTGMLMRRHTLDGGYVGGLQPSLAAWTLPMLVQTATYVGGCGWRDNTDAAATFDEVRIWKGALTAADIEANAAASCDTVLKSFRETAKFRFLQNGQRWGARPLADGLYLDRRGLTLIVR